MKRYTLVAFGLLGAAAHCQAQTTCDSVYAAEDKFLQDFYSKGNIGLIRFSIAPSVTFGKEQLVTYTTSKDSVGAVMYRVVIDSWGNTSCLRLVHANNNLIIEKANRLVNTLKYHPAEVNNRTILSTMYVVVRFQNSKPKQHRF
ncbi:MAG: hypothetical protein JWR44_3070 [Hymenobacter sp.]|jgi:hypothetical protein|nr:hypothetical protein [Hymenobacter sp.]